VETGEAIQVACNTFDEEISNSEALTTFIADVLNPIAQAFQKVGDLEGFPDVQEQYIRELGILHAMSSLALRRLVDPSFNVASNNFNRSGDSLLLADESRSTVVAMTASFEVIGNTISIACNTPDALVLRTILDSLCRQKVDPSERFPYFDVRDIGLVTTFFADMDGWTEPVEGLYSRTFPYDPEQPELDELREWFKFNETSLDGDRDDSSGVSSLLLSTRNGTIGPQHPRVNI
jgi:hypothetical protein